MTQEQTDKIFNLITSNGCREMEETRFNQAVSEIVKEIITDFKLYASLAVAHPHVPKTKWQELNGHGCLKEAIEEIRNKYLNQKELNNY